MNDVIYRQAAIDAVFGRSHDIIKQRLKNLPSTQPEILACGEGELSAQPERRSFSCGQENDMISRQMLLEYIHGEPVGKLLCDKYNLDGLIEQFPSALPEQLKNSGDIWDKLSEVYNMDSVPDEAKSIIGDVMIAVTEQPEIVRCNDCKYWEQESICEGYCSELELDGFDEDHFCGYAERREG